MNAGERSFWEAVVQIIPVLLLALVVEARALKPSPRRLKKFRKQLRKLDQPDGRRIMTYAWRLNRVMWKSGGLPLYMMLITAALLTAAEFVGLFTLYLDVSPSMLWMAVSVAGLAIGVMMVSLAPVAAAFGRVMWSLPSPPARQSNSDGSDPGE